MSIEGVLNEEKFIEIWDKFSNHKIVYYRELNNLSQNALDYLMRMYPNEMTYLILYAKSICFRECAACLKFKRAHLLRPIKFWGETFYNCINLSNCNCDE